MKRNILTIGLVFAMSTIFFSCNELLNDSNLQPNLKIANSDFSKDSNQSRSIIPEDEYIVIYKDETSDDELNIDIEDIDKSEGIKPEFVYKKAIKGFTARLSPSALAKLKKNIKVDYIEKNQVMSINAVQTLTVNLWGIDRIDQASLPLTNLYSYTATGVEVDAYIIDTGIFTNHQEFGGRAVGGYSAISNSSPWLDEQGHGTHVAGTVGGSTYGVAKNTKLIAVKVLGADGSGTTAGVIAGINWVISQRTTRPAVANMSLGGGASRALDDAVKKAINAGIVMCVAAGNDRRNASNYSPARVSSAITVGATGATPLTGTNFDRYASYSNFGSIVDIFAPGTSIVSAGNTGTTAEKTLSGTSMATPHVTGVAVLYLSKNPSHSPATVETALKSTSTKNKIAGLPKGTANNLLFTNH